MVAPSRYTSGVTHANKIGPLRNYPAPDPRRLHQFWDDFDNYTAADWVITDVGTDTRAVSAGADGGVLVLTTGGTEDDGTFLQYSGATSSTTVETFKFAAGQQLWFACRFKIDLGTQSDFVMGLQVTDTTPIAVADGVFFRKDDGDANIDFVVISSGASNTTTTAIATITDATYTELAFYHNGVDAIEYYKDGIKLGTVAVTNMPSTELTVSFGVQAGSGAAVAMSIDYILAAKTRTVI